MSEIGPAGRLAQLSPLSRAAPVGALADALYARWLIEPQVAALAAQRAGLDEVLALRATVRSPAAGFLVDVGFHRAVALAARNRIVAAMIEDLLTAIPTEVHRQLLILADSRDHERILRAIEQGRRSDAYCAMQVHLGPIRGAAEKIEAHWRAAR